MTDEQRGSKVGEGIISSFRRLMALDCSRLGFYPRLPTVSCPSAQDNYDAAKADARIPSVYLSRQKSNAPGS
jgi:hypothetical protein